MKKIFLALVAVMLCGGIASAQEIRYQGEIDLGYSIGVGDLPLDRINAHTVQGVAIGGHLSTGIGVGADYYYDSSELVIPVYLNVKGYLFSTEDHKVTPYASFDIGYGIYTGNGPSGGLMATPAVGVKLGKFKAQVGYNVQKMSAEGVSVNFNAIKFSLGFMF